MTADANPAKNVALNGDSPVYRQVQEHLLSEIASMAAGDRLPPERFLASRYNIDRATLRRALLNLTNEGYVVRQQGRGTFVTGQSGADLVGAQIADAKQNAKGASGFGNGVSLIVPDLEIPSHAGLLRGMLSCLSENNVRAWVNSSLLDADYECELLDKLSKEDVSGVITVPLFENCYDRKYVELLQRLTQSGKRVVLVEQYVWDRSIRSVMMDRVKSSYLLTEHLIMSGHRKIAVFSPNKYSSSGSAYFRGYQQAMADYNQPVDSELVFNIPVKESAQPAYERAKALLSDGSFKCSAISAAPFSIAYGVYRAIKELGLQDEIELVGEDLHFNPELAHLTHARQPHVEIGRRAVELLLAPEDNENLKRHVLVEPEFVIHSKNHTQ